MRFASIMVFAFATFVLATPTKRHTDPDDLIVYPDEKLYAQDFKRDADDSIVYPDKNLYSEEFKRDMDDMIVYPDEKLYAEDF